MIFVVRIRKYTSVVVKEPKNEVKKMDREEDGLVDNWPDLVTFDDLRRLVETETFSKIEFPGENRYEEPKLYVSDKWAQLNGIFIPIEWIHGIEYNLIKCKVLGATEVFSC